MRIILGLLCLGLALAIPHAPRAPVCGYESCPKPVAGKLNVHLVPHTHDDVGWLKTVDQYYYGSKNNIQNAGVQYIIDSVVSALLVNPARKFIIVETSFFWMWWVEQTPELQEQVKQLVNEGRLEFIGGAWSMNDEATTHYQTTIDQFTYGHKKLNETFGTCGQPKVGWQIDPFGHSREQASLMAQYGFDGLFFARLDYQDKNNRVSNRNMEIVWETSPTLGETTDLFTSAFYFFYTSPAGFCFDIMCDDEPIIDNPKSFDYNVPRRVKEFVKHLRGEQKAFRTDNVIVAMGGDFNYQAAHSQFKNTDKLIRYVNEQQSDINVFYSTPSCYLKAVNEAGLTWGTKQDDFFPYASDANSYWTGYFTSRSTLKYFERISNGIFQVAKQLTAVTGRSADDLEEIGSAMGILQHHDGITGTEKQAVAEDYARLLDRAVVKTEEVIQSALNSIVKKNDQAPDLGLNSCRLLNITECDVTSSSDAFLVTIYNPLSRPSELNVRLPVQDASYRVQGPDGEDVVAQLVPVPDAVNSIPGRTSTTPVELVFVAANLPPFGYRSYYISQSQAKSTRSSKTWVPQPGEPTVVDAGTMQFILDAETKFLKSLRLPNDTYDFEQSLQYYNGHDNNGRASGAYIFRPADTEARPISDNVETKVVNGDVVVEIQQRYNDWASQVVRHYKSYPDQVEIEWLVGPIPVDDKIGKEVINKMTTSIASNSEFTTDSNGREILRRRKDYRPTWELDNHEPIAANYYPIVSRIAIDDGKVGMTVLTDRAQGGSSMEDGSLEVMVHRRLLYDDGFGAGEALNEQAYNTGLVARGRHTVLIGELASIVEPKKIRKLELEKFLSSLVLVSDVTGQSQSDVANNYNLESTPIASALPDQVQILTLEPWKEGSVLLRLEHLFSQDEDSTVATVDLTKLFSSFNVLSARETSLSTLKWIEDVERLEWKKESNEIPSHSFTSSKVPLAVDAIELGPRQIRTFVVDVEPKK